MRLFLVFALAMAMGCDAAESRVVNIAVVRDGPSWFADEITAMVDAELQQSLGDTIQIHFKADDKFDAGWKTERVAIVLQNALADPDSSIVLVTGPLVSLFAAHSDLPLGKPVLSTAGNDPRLMGFPADASGRSTRPNFAFIADPQRVEKDIQTFHRLVPAKRIHVVVDSHATAVILGIKDLMNDLGEQLGVKFTGVASNTKADDVLGAAGPNIEAMYVMPMLAMPRDERLKLFATLAERKIPVFSQLGDEEVHQGALAGLSRDHRARIAHLAALDLQQIIRGVSPNVLGGNLAPSDSLLINGQVARQTGYAPDFDTKVEADFIHPELLETGDALSLENAMNLAGENNADIAVQQAAIEKAREQSGVAHSALLPQVSAQARYSQIDHERAVDSNRGVAERDTRAGLRASQIIYDEAAKIREKISHRTIQQNARDEDRARLDAMNAAGSNYLEMLLARSLYEIERDNLRLTRQHLNLARNRYQLGAAGQDEVLRFESEEALQRGNVMTAEANIEKARIALNRAMGAGSELTWNPQPIAMADGDSYFLNGTGIVALSGDAKAFARFRDFSVLKALDASPELKSIDESIASQRLVIEQKQRGFYVPQVAASAGYDRILDQHFEGTDFASQLAQSGLPVSQTRHEDNEWQAGVTATLPIFESGARKHDIAAEQAQLDQLEQSRVKIAQQIEQRVLNAVYTMQASHPKIGLARIAADRSRRSLKIVSDKYTRGATQIIDVLDAQNQALRQEINSAVAMTNYLQDMLEYQRSIAWFEKFQSPEARTAWINHFRRFAGQMNGEKTGMP
jgi:outer membrane protein TolC